ncbi:DUF3168 domain-containing protein [Methylosinus sp. Ce-a6]|uniref:DUF3168 domain-containing protein n=1 Tax=Methylosinus sp. Ce-a6 TaxID=2172005 RepID=UPI0013595AD0|nr:DUF3168 domain-containing protein [Methylosinus sp. Ce-a6]
MAASLPLDAAASLIAAVRSALLANSTLAGMLAGSKVVTLAPSGHQTPYISIAIRSNDWSTATEDGQEVLLDLNVWHQPDSQTPEGGAARAIMALCRQTLHTASLTLASPFKCTLIRVTNEIGPYRDPDGRTVHGLVSVRALVDHT